MPAFGICLLLAAMVNCGMAAPQEDLITDLPGLSWTPGFKQYSGYLKASGTKQLHYWFTESENNPKSDPIVLWLNGGPGCSSLIGLLTENGPFRVAKGGRTLMRNPHAWNTMANVIFLEAPAGVGFSYSRDRNYTTNDDITIRDNHLALTDFFSKFPEYKSNDFFITGESYGGMYVPLLSSSVLNDSAINLKGFAVGNGYSDVKKNGNSLIYFLKFHGVFGEEKWQTLWEECCQDTKANEYCDFVGGAQKSRRCKQNVKSATELAFNSGLNPYNLYKECAGGARHDPKLDSSKGKYAKNMYGYPASLLENLGKRRSTPVSTVNVMASPPCTDNKGIDTYLGLGEVRKALHIPSEVQDYATCSNIFYTSQYQTMAPQYQRAISAGLRIVVYNGDVDMACNFIGDEWFVDDLHAKDPQQRKVWHVREEDSTMQVAGYYKAFLKSKLTFVTVKGSGHFVPQDKPIAALKVFAHLIKGTPLDG